MSGRPRLPSGEPGRTSQRRTLAQCQPQPPLSRAELALRRQGPLARLHRGVMKDGVVQLGDIAGKIAIFEVACRRCERRGRLRITRLIEQHGDMRLPELRYILAGDCPKAAVASISERCSVYFPQIRPE